MARWTVVGIIIGLVGIAAAWVGVASEGDDSGGWGGILLVPVIVVLTLLFALVTGLLGCERDVGLLAGVGTALSIMILMLVRSVQLDHGAAGIVVSFVFGVGTFVVCRLVAWIGWWVGDSIASLAGLPTERRLVAKVYGVDRSGSTWVDDAAEQLERSLRELVDTELHDADSVTAIGVEHRAVRSRPLAVALGSSLLVLRPLRMNGHLDGTTTRIDVASMVGASIRSQRRDGSRRRVVNVYDDLIELRTADGRTVRFSLPYGGDAGTDSPEEDIRRWVRQHAATYV